MPRGLHVKLALIIALGALACAMSTEAWRTYKESDAYKQERALIEARKERARSFQSDVAKNAGQSSVKAPAYSYIYTATICQDNFLRVHLPTAG